MQGAITTPTYTDFAGLAEMRARSRVDPQASLRKVAKQFEGIFIQMMLKSMRDASMGDDIFDSDQSKLYRDMFDKQIALDMASGKGIGIADTLVRQLSRNKSGHEAATSYPATAQQRQFEVPEAGKILPPQNLETPGASGTESHNDADTTKDISQFKNADEFRRYLMPYAEKAAAKLGVSPELLVSQAALETGWGKAIATRPDGSSSYNLFNIKADHRWQGDRIVKTTLEYDNGIAKYEKASFRAYHSYADSFNDYVNFLRSNSRYADALQWHGDNQRFIKGLQQAGYATDPNYADKVMDIFYRTFSDRDDAITLAEQVS